MSLSKRVLIHFSGRVQGVGFRYTTCELAARFPIAGTVKNCGNGTVELVAEGTTQDLADFLQTIRSSRLGRWITNEEIQWKKADGSFNQFGISFE